MQINRTGISFGTLLVRVDDRVNPENTTQDILQKKIDDLPRDTISRTPHTVFRNIMEPFLRNSRSLKVNMQSSSSPDEYYMFVIKGIPAQEKIIEHELLEAGIEVQKA